jgi:hypothetical protein
MKCGKSLGWLRIEDNGALSLFLSELSRRQQAKLCHFRHVNDL